MISKFAIECHDYYTTSSSLTWKDSEIRNWLNNGFYYEAFSLDEQTTIQNTKLFTNRIHESGTSTTEDKVFLLSQNEAETYFSNSESRKCEPTIYMKRQFRPVLMKILKARRYIGIFAHPQVINGVRLMLITMAILTIYHAKLIVLSKSMSARLCGLILIANH